LRAARTGRQWRRPRPSAGAERSTESAAAILADEPRKHRAEPHLAATPTLIESRATCAMARAQAMVNATLDAIAPARGA
jgi:hypothetical protein